MVATVQNLIDPVAFVLGGDAPYVKWDDLSANQRLAIVIEVREWVRGLLGSLPGFKTLEESIYESCCVKADELELAGPWGWQQRCRLVMAIDLGSLGLSCTSAGQKASRQQYLYTDRDGNWYVVAIFSRLSYFGTTTTPQPRAFRVVCAPMSDEQVEKVAVTQGRVVYVVLKKLLTTARESLEQRMAAYSAIEERIAGMEQRIV